MSRRRLALLSGFMALILGMCLSGSSDGFLDIFKFIFVHLLAFVTGQCHVPRSGIMKEQALGLSNDILDGYLYIYECFFFGFLLMTGTGFIG
jgi:hypothetical protein